MAQSHKVSSVKDYEVLGVGASRREELLKKAPIPLLLTHPGLVPPEQFALYQALLQETLAWLKPSEVRPQVPPQAAADFIVELLLADLKMHFPQTSSYLKGGLRELIKDYLKEMPWQGPLVSAHLRYFPIFLKRKFQDARLYLIAQREWLWSYLSFADFGFPPPEAGRIFVNPSLQSLYTEEDISEVQLTSGLSVFYYDYAQFKICEYKMDVWDAALVDVLQEDRKFNQAQLLEQVGMMELESPLARTEWEKKLSCLISAGMILQSVPNEQPQ